MSERIDWTEINAELQAALRRQMERAATNHDELGAAGQGWTMPVPTESQIGQYTMPPGLAGPPQTVTDGPIHPGSPGQHEANEPVFIDGPKEPRLQAHDPVAAPTIEDDPLNGSDADVHEPDDD